MSVYIIAEAGVNHNGNIGLALELADKAKEAGAPIEVTGFVCFELGEGIEKKADDFAAEVASMIG